MSHPRNGIDWSAASVGYDGLDPPSIVPPGAQLSVDEQGPESVKATVHLGRWRVAAVVWTADGRLDCERYFDRGGLACGVERGWRDGRIAWCNAWRDGQRHGPSIAFDANGHPFSVTVFEGGTGVELGWCGGAICAIRPRLSGALHGLTRQGDPERPTAEDTYAFGRRHGISRRWDERGALTDGFPRYFVRDEQISATDYDAARALDASLPAYRAEDDHQPRACPAIVAEARARAAEWVETFDVARWLTEADSVLAEAWSEVADVDPVDPLTLARSSRYQRPEWAPAEAEIVVLERNDHVACGEIRLGDRRVALASWTLTGWLYEVTPFDPQGRRHGVEREYRHAPWLGGRGAISWTQTWHHGVRHGLSLLLDTWRRPITASVFDHGTGMRIWEDPSCEPWESICEAYPYVDGRKHGRTRWEQPKRSSPDDDIVDGPDPGPNRWTQPKCMYMEEVFADGRLHGASREWDDNGVLRYGSPTFHVGGEKVSRETYDTMCLDDPTLAPYRPEDDMPDRAPLPAVEEALDRAAQMRPTFELAAYINAEDAKLAAIWCAVTPG